VLLSSEGAHIQMVLRLMPILQDFVLEFSPEVWVNLLLILQDLIASCPYILLTLLLVNFLMDLQIHLSLQRVRFDVTELILQHLRIVFWRK